MDHFPLLEGQLLISGPALEPNNSNLLILHLHYLTHTEAQMPTTSIFMLSLPSSQLLTYTPTDVDYDFVNAICNLQVIQCNDITFHSKQVLSSCGLNYKIKYILGI